jgi:hypothetical protein
VTDSLRKSFILHILVQLSVTFFQAGFTRQLTENFASRSKISRLIRSPDASLHASRLPLFCTPCLKLPSCPSMPRSAWTPHKKVAMVLHKRAKRTLNSGQTDTLPAHTTNHHARVTWLSK